MIVERPPSPKEIKYSAAIQLLTYEGQVSWARFNSIVTAQSIFFATIGVLIKSELDLIICALSLIGILISILWLVMTIRGFAMLKYYILCARELEEEIDPPKKDLYFNFFKRGNDFRNNKIVAFKLLNSDSKYHVRPDFGRIIDTNWAAYLIICLFIMLYIIILFSTLSGI
jgi:hypothetical protein